MGVNLGMQTLGRITVTTGGTPVNALAQSNAASRNSGQDLDQTANLVVPCYSVTIEAWPTNNGRIWIGIAEAMETTNGTWVVGWIGTGGAQSIALPRGAAMMGHGLIDLGKIWLDAQNDGESALVTYLRG